jgi:hypothetical protein
LKVLVAKNLMTEAQVDGKMEGVLTTLREEATAAKQAMGVEVDNKIAAAAGNGLTEAQVNINKVSERVGDVELELGMDKGKARSFRDVERALGMDGQGRARNLREMEEKLQHERRRRRALEEVLEMNDGKSDSLDGFTFNQQMISNDVIDGQRRLHRRINNLGHHVGLDDGERSWPDREF